MKNKILYIVLGISLATAITGYYFYQKIFGKAVLKDTKIYIYKGDSITDISQKLKTFVTSPSDFEWLADKKKFTQPKSGMYTLTKGMSTNDIVNKLRSGNQTAIKVRFNNQDSLEKLAGRIANQLEVDSLSLLKAMKDSLFLNKNGFNNKSALAMYIPNQYDCYWNTSAEKFRNKMLYYYKKFWNDSRVLKAKKIGLSKQEVMTLASIVQKESSQAKEQPIIAGLYLNRLKDDWPLQSDPTVIYALKEKQGHDKVFKRVLNKDLLIQSPYNTYQHTGLPPSLIAMPDISAIDAVLNPAQHNYYYMCASVTNIGFHAFARTLQEHNRNAKKYQNWINKKEIFR